jgi:4-alpha-glucanotransferase
MERRSGVLMHVSSLHGDHSIGSFGKEAREFIDLLADCHFGYWQMLPFCMTDECNSPYKSYSAFGGNPFFIDLPTLAQKGFFSTDELKNLRNINLLRKN